MTKLGRTDSCEPVNKSDITGLMSGANEFCTKTISFNLFTYANFQYVGLRILYVYWVKLRGLVENPKRLVPYISRNLEASSTQALEKPLPDHT